MANDLSIEQPDIHICNLGATFTPEQLQEQAHVLYGGIAWPGKRPGFGVVLALSKEKHFEGYNIYLLDEVEASDIRELVHRCAALDAKYTPIQWAGDSHNSAADRFIQELIARQQPQANAFGEMLTPRHFYICSSQLLDMERPYEYMLPTLKALLDQERRCLFLKNSLILSYLGEVKPDEIPYLEWGEYPAIEALTFALHETGYWRPPERRSRNPRRRHFM